MFKSIGHNLAGLVRFSGRDARETFWPYALVLFGLSLVAMALVFIPSFVETMTRMQRFAAEHPELTTVTRGPGSTSMQIRGSHPELMPDFTGAMNGMTAVALIFAALVAAAVTRRLHDRGSTGAWGLLPLLFLVIGAVLMPGEMQGFRTGAPNLAGFFLLFFNNLLYLASLGWLLFLLARDGTAGPNRYGEDPTPPEVRLRRRSPPRPRD